MLKTRLPQAHQGRAVSLDGAGLSDGRGDACDANLDHGLIIVVGQIVLSAGRKKQAAKLRILIIHDKINNSLKWHLLCKYLHNSQRTVYWFCLFRHAY